MSVSSPRGQQKAIKHPIPIVDNIPPDIATIAEQIKKTTLYLTHLRQIIIAKKLKGNLTSIQVAISNLDQASDKVQLAITGKSYHDE